MLTLSPIPNSRNLFCTAAGMRAIATADEAQLWGGSAVVPDQLVGPASLRLVSASTDDAERARQISRVTLAGTIEAPVGHADAVAKIVDLPVAAGAVDQQQQLTLSGTPSAGSAAVKDRYSAEVVTGLVDDIFSLTCRGVTKTKTHAAAQSKVQSIALSGTPQEATHKTVAIQVLAGPWNPASPGPGIFTFQADGGANYEAYNLGAPVPGDMALALRDAVNNGTKDVVGLILTGTTLITDNPSISIAGDVNSPYSHTGEITNQAMAEGLAAAIQGDVTATYDAVAVNPAGPTWAVILTARTIGAGGAHVVTNTPDGGTGFSQFQIVTAVNASPNWVASVVTDTVTCVLNDAGSSSQDVVPTDNGTVPGSWTSVLSDVDGQGPSYLELTDGLHGYSAVYVGGGLNALAILLRDAIDGHDGYVAVLDGIDPNKVLVSQSPAADFTLSDDAPQFNGVVEVIGVAQAYVAADDATSIAAALVAQFTPAGYTLGAVAGVITAENTTAGAADPLGVVSSKTGMTGSFIPTHEATGADASDATVVQVSDGTTTYTTAPYTSGGLAALATDLAGQIDGHGYTASPAGAVVTVAAAPTFAFVDASTGSVTVGVATNDPGGVVDVPAVGAVAGVLLGVTAAHYTVLEGDDLAAVAAGLAAAIVDALAYTATSLANVATVVHLSDFTLVDDSTGNLSIAVSTRRAFVPEQAAEADVFAIGDGRVSWSHAVLGSETLAEIAADLAEQAGHDGYLAEVDPDHAGQLTIAGGRGESFTLTDLSVDQVAGGTTLSATVEEDQAATNPTGAQVVQVHVLGPQGLTTIGVEMAGTDPAEFDLPDSCTVVGLATIQAGTGGTSAGDIACTNADGDQTYASLQAGASGDGSCQVVVPAGYGFFLTALLCSNGTATAGRLRVRATRLPGQDAEPVDAGLVVFDCFVGSLVQYGPAQPIGPFAAGTRIWMSGEGSGAALTGRLDGYMSPI